MGLTTTITAMTIILTMLMTSPAMMETLKRAMLWMRVKAKSWNEQYKTVRMHSPTGSGWVAACPLHREGNCAFNHCPNPMFWRNRDTAAVVASAASLNDENSPARGTCTVTLHRE